MMWLSDIFNFYYEISHFFTYTLLPNSNNHPLSTVFLSFEADFKTIMPNKFKKNKNKTNNFSRENETKTNKTYCFRKISEIKNLMDRFAIRLELAEKEKVTE